jgi:hypothetical protein
MINTFVSIAAPFLGWCIAAALLFVEAFPLLIGLLIAFNLLRYREWLAIVAVTWSMAILAGSGDYIYNLMNWTSSRFPPGINIASCVLIFLTPPFLIVLVLTHSQRRWLWGLGILVPASLSVISFRSEFVARKERDAEAYRQAVRPLSPRAGTSLVQWWREYRLQPEKVLLLGHVPEATPVVLLTDPFTRSFQPQFCTGTASAYWPPVKDPAELGNVTEVAGMKGCSKTWTRGIAALERSVTNYRAIPFQPLSRGLDREALNYPVVRRAFETFRYDLANFDASKAELSQAIGPRQTVLFIMALKPIRIPPKEFQCSDPALLISIHDVKNVQAVLPYCARTWNFFQLDDELYFAATTEQPVPPVEGIVDHPDYTSWLFRAEQTELKQLWPSP